MLKKVEKKYLVEMPTLKQTLTNYQQGSGEHGSAREISECDFGNLVVDLDRAGGILKSLVWQFQHPCGLFLVTLATGCGDYKELAVRVSRQAGIFLT